LVAIGNGNGLGKVEVVHQKCGVGIGKPPRSGEINRQALTSIVSNYSAFKSGIIRLPSLAPYHIEYVVDAGANVGYATIFFQKIFSRSACFPVEPDAGNCGLLLENIRVSHLENVFPVKAAHRRQIHGRTHPASNRSAQNGYRGCRSFDLFSGCAPGAIPAQDEVLALEILEETKAREQIS